MRVLQNIQFTASGMPVIQLVASAGSGGGGQTTGSSWSPSAFGSNLVAWFKADAGLSVSGSNVTAWADQSATGLFVNEATPGPTQTVRPVYSATAIGTGPGVTFQGDTGMPMVNCASATGTSPLADSPALKFTPSTPMSLAFAFKLGSIQTLSELLGFTQLTAGEGWYIVLNGGKPGLAFVGSNADGYPLLMNAVSSALTVGKSYIFVISYDGSNTGANISIYQNGAAAATTVVGASFTTGKTNIASPQYLVIGGGGGQTQQSNTSAAGYANLHSLGELLVVNRAMTATEIASAATYLDGRFNIY